MRSSLPRSVGSCARLGRRRFRCVRLVQALPSPPPPLVLLRVRRPPLFFFLALSGFARSAPGVLVLVFAPSLFFCVPLLGSRLSSLSSHSHSHLIFGPHFILIFTSFATLPKAGCVCVYHLNRCKTSVSFLDTTAPCRVHRYQHACPKAHTPLYSSTLKQHLAAAPSSDTPLKAAPSSTLQQQPAAAPWSGTSMPAPKRSKRRQATPPRLVVRTPIASLSGE